MPENGSVWILGAFTVERCTGVILNVGEWAKLIKLYVLASEPIIVILCHSLCENNIINGNRKTEVTFRIKRIIKKQQQQ